MAQRADEFRKAIVTVLDTAVKPRERNRELTAAAERYAPDSFVTWAAKERSALDIEWEMRHQRLQREYERDEVALDRLDALYQARDVSDTAPRNERDDDRAPAIDPQKTANLEVAIASVLPIAGTAAQHYLCGRGLSVVDGIHYSENWTKDVITNSGRTSPGHGPAVVFPFTDPAGNIVAAQGRFIDPPVMGGKALKMWSVGNISQGVFATPGAWDAPVVGICEAPIDALSLADCGLPAIALGGTQNQPTFLADSLAGREIILALDADAPGIAAADNLTDLLDIKCVMLDRLALPANIKDVNEALLRAPDALRSEVERIRQEGNPLNHAWVRAHVEAKLNPQRTAAQAITNRGFGNLPAAELQRLERAESLQMRSVRPSVAERAAGEVLEPGVVQQRAFEVPKKARGKRR